MADQKISELTAATALVDVDEIELRRGSNNFRADVSLLGGRAYLLVASNGASATVKARADQVCNGTNDNVEIQAAIDALPAGGGVVVLSDGTFTISSTINIAVNDTVLEGQGYGVTIITGDGTLEKGFSVTASCYFKKLTLDNLGRAIEADHTVKADYLKIKYCSFTNINVGTFRNIAVRSLDTDAGVTRLIISWCVLDDVGGRGLSWEAPFDWAWITNNFITNIGGGPGGGDSALAILFGNSTIALEDTWKHGTFAYNYFENIDGAGAGDTNALLLYGREYSVIGNHIQSLTTGNPTGGDCEGINLKSRRGIIAYNTLIDGGLDQAAILIKGDIRTAPIKVAGYAVICVHNQVFITANTVEFASGIAIDNEDVLCAYNLVEGVTDIGIRVEGGRNLNNVVITHNLIRKVDKSQFTGSTHGIRVTNSGDHLIVNDNTIEEVIAAAGSQPFGIRFSMDGTGTAQDWECNRNRVFTLTGLSRKGIRFDKATAAITGLEIAGNLVRGVDVAIDFDAQAHDEISIYDNWLDAATPIEFDGLAHTNLRVWNNRGANAAGVTFTDQDTTPTVSNRDGFYLTANTLATTITDFDDGEGGQIINIHFNDALTTIADNANIRLNGNVNLVTPAVDSTLTLQLRGTVWYEIGRNVQ